ncbi:PAS and ANTAR domain-containing protein [Nocardioides sp. Kera G14]|uniref:PAS and ANTAR domain-containing protein n=1 Tax=Nocardioides sp. Kera G14 TaxID=2884264 RepID=UPI001D11692F|nr:PAS and ANTAR domain-containing protein [Nocardioides sp. Kera G14]UDY24939.1 PAS and ANTAR domain-containing protein [Nocardioides sp. Kera G14]
MSLPTSRQVGRFVYDHAAERWTWDAGVYAIHGYEDGEVSPTTDLVLSHKHESDRERVQATLISALSTGEPFTLYYRIITHGSTEERTVMMVGEAINGDKDARKLQGYYLDLTPDLSAGAIASGVIESRAVIEQAKGALMLSYGLDANAAFAMLRWWSRNRNIRVRELAERVVQVATEGHVTHPGLRKLLDAVLDDLTAPEPSLV